MHLKFFFLVNNILSSEKHSSIDSQAGSKKVRSPQESSIDTIVGDVTLLFKNNETLKVDYTELKRFFLFRDAKIAVNIATGRPFVALSSFYKRAFLTLMDTFNKNKGFGLLIKFFNYEDLGHIVDLAIVLQPNPLIGEIFRQIYTLDNPEFELEEDTVRKINKQEIAIEDPSTISLIKEQYFVFANRLLERIPYLVPELAENLNSLYKDKEFKFVTNFVVRYSQHKAIQYIFSDNFRLLVKIGDEDDEFMGEPPSMLEHPIRILFISKTIGEYKSNKFNIYEEQINYIIGIYRQKFGEDWEISCEMSSLIEEKNDSQFLVLLKDKYNLKILKTLPSSELPKESSARNGFLTIFQIKYLGVKFENSPSKLTCNQKVEFKTVERKEMEREYF